MISTMNKIILNNKLINGLYKIKFYMDVAVGQVSWFTGKLPEIMASIYLLEKFGFVVSKANIIFYCLVIAILIFLLGFCWKKLGLYDIDMIVSAERNPVSNEVYKAAKKINRRNL